MLLIELLGFRLTVVAVATGESDELGGRRSQAASTSDLDLSALGVELLGVHSLLKREVVPRK